MGEVSEQVVVEESGLEGERERKEESRRERERDRESRREREGQSETIKHRGRYSKQGLTV